MDAEACKVDKKKVHFKDAPAQEVMFTYKRKRRREPKKQPRPQVQSMAQPEPRPPQAQERAQPKPQQQLQPQQQAYAQSEIYFWKRRRSCRDIGWKHAIMIDVKRRHWKCVYCGLIRCSGGVSSLNLHLTGVNVKRCPKVPANVVEEIRVHLREKQERQLERRRKQASQNASNDITIKRSSDEGIVQKNLLPADLVVPAEMDTNCLEEVTNQTSMVHQDPTCPRVSNTSSQCAAESNGQPIEHCDQPEEQWAMDHGKMHQMMSNKHQISNKSTKNSKNPKALDPHWKKGCSTRKHIVIVDASARHWRCRYCGMDGYGKKFRLHYHLAGAFGQPKCPSVPKHVFAKARHYVRTKKNIEKGKSGQQVPSGLHMVGQSGVELQRISPLCGNRQQLPVNAESNQPTMEEGPQENRLFNDTNKSENQRSGCWTNCWRNVLDGLMHSPGVQEGAGIWTCICDALLYGCAQLGTVPDTVEPADGMANVNTAKCQNVLMDVLRSEDFVLLCNILCRAVHQDGAKTRYFDFGVIDSRMRNGNYGHEPRLFLHDLKLVWEDLKMAGQSIIQVANSLSSLTEASCGNLAGREKESGDNELRGAVVSSSGPTNFVESNASVISTSEGYNHLHQSDRVDLDQSDPVDFSDIRKGSTCNQCGKEARGGSVLTCTKCMLSCHISCTEPPFPSISTESWYCRNCSIDKSIEDDMVMAHYQPNCLHKNCVACDRLEVCSSPKLEDSPNDNSRAMALYNVGSVEDSELPEIDTVGSCKICGNPEEEDKRFLICGHIHCLCKYYHISCLKSKQMASDFQRDKPCWYCPSCLCRVCLSDKDDVLTILCDGCDEAYHLNCITPHRTSIPNGEWYCPSCSIKRVRTVGSRHAEPDCSSCSIKKAMTIGSRRKSDVGEGRAGGREVEVMDLRGGSEMRQYERRMPKLHGNVYTRRLQRRKYDGVDLLLSAADMLSADEQLVSCTN